MSRLIEVLFFWMHRQTLRARYFIVIAMTLVLAVIDYFTGYEFGFSLFYLLPVSAAAWFISIEVGYAFSVICAVLWGVLDLRSGHEYSNYVFPIWNAVMRAGFYWIEVKLLSVVRRAFEKERVLSRTDFLTGVFNARFIHEQIASELERYKRYEHQFVLAYVDLDNFKTVNDTMGHSEGDRVLQLVTQTMRKTLRKVDLVGRMGGDEFLIILPHTDQAGACRALEKMEQTLMTEMHENKWPVTFSIGAITPKARHETVNDLIRDVDSVMYKVKHKGKNAILFDAA